MYMEDLYIIYFIVVLIIFISLWKVFEKAGRKGWEALIPIYNLFIIQKIIKKPWWWVLLMMIPWVGVIWTIWSTNLLSKSFSKSEGFTLGMIFFPFIFYPILAFGNAQYIGSETQSPTSELIDSSKINYSEEETH